MRILRCSPLALTGLICSAPAAAQEARFDPAFLNAAVSSVTDLSVIEAGGTVSPGDYDVDIYINGQFTELRRVTFRPRLTSPGQVVPLFSAADLTFFGLRPEALPAPVAPDLYDIGTIDGIIVSFEASRQRLEISVPQTLLEVRPRGYIPESRWDDGITAALLDYSMSYSNNTTPQSSSDRYFLNLNGGVNVGPWRYREFTTGSYDDKSKKWQWATPSRYIERPLRALRSTLRAGDQSTPGDIFESVNTRGITLASEQAMLPDSMQGFAPVIRGIAATNAVVTVSQNGYPIYETSVAPGAFELRDVTPVANSGELTVRIRESDGRITQFVVPYSAVPVFVREGTFRYDMTAGETRADQPGQRVPMLQGTLAYGLLSRMTTYGGVQTTPDYRAALAGIGLDLGNAGALSADVTTARSALQDGKRDSGQSWRFLYAKSIENTGTSFQLAGYRYSTRGFRTLNEHLAERGNLEGFGSGTAKYGSSRKENYQLTLSQRINDTNSLFINASRNTWWDRRGADTLIQLGHGTTVGNVTISTFASYSTSGSGGPADKSFAISFSVPMTVFGDRPVMASYTASHNQGRVSHMAGLGGTAGEEEQLQYSLYDTLTPDNGDNQGSLSGTWRGRRGVISTSYSAGRDSRQLSAALHGGAVLHAGGLTLGQPLGETNILVEAKDAENLAISSRTGVRTDSRGYALVPSASIYRENTVSLDAASWNDRVELSEPVRKVVPSRGAVVKAVFPVSVGDKALVTLIRNGQFLPFGTLVRARGKAEPGIVDEHGQVFLSGLTGSTELNADWGQNLGCRADLTVPEQDTETGIHYLRAECK